MGLIDYKAEEICPDLIVDKGLLLKFKEQLSLPDYIIEQLIIKYNGEKTSDKEVQLIAQTIKDKIVKARDSLEVQSRIIEEGSSLVIDKVRTIFNNDKQEYQCQLSNLDIKDVIIPRKLAIKYTYLLNNSLWSEIKLKYCNEKKRFEIEELEPLEFKDFNLEDFKERRKKFTTFQWTCLLLRSVGLEPLELSKRKKLLYLSRLIPFVEKNYNFVELGLRGTGKSYLYRQFSRESILVSGGKTTVANLFYNMGTRTIGLVGDNDVVAFDEVAYIDFKDKTAIQILKDYMESGSFSRGKEEINTDASMVFLGNINEDISMLLNRSHLFAPLPELMQDIALIDRFHFYLPGWEMDKLKDNKFTKHYGLQSSYLATALNHLRELDFTQVVDDYFLLDDKLDIRDERAIKKTLSGYIKLLHPAGDFTKEDLKLYLDIALEGRKRVKKQLIKMGSFEYKEVGFKYIDIESKEVYRTFLPEAKTGLKYKILPPGTVYIGEVVGDDKFALLKLEIHCKAGKGKLIFRGELDQGLKKNIRKTFLIIKAKRLHGDLKEQLNNNDFYVTATPVLNEVTSDISNPFLIAIYSLLNNKSVAEGLLVTENSSFYRKYKVNQSIKTIKVEGDNGQIKILFPLKSNIFVEVPSKIGFDILSFLVV
ncbi:TIGR02688 family protein [Orenia metallireducens]|uniref:TIGR02688 family protein n=1 Tax=Orenia metallireducens TaxID=1413210 RepID=A0A1C0AD46_9FIRM|nr:BREX system Lon protease-like protein BrxL [Orenia metallireducens]OCL28545.1 TIGR02688 family protein [Orenia metallireducens]